MNNESCYELADSRDKCRRKECVAVEGKLGLLEEMLSGGAQRSLARVSADVAVPAGKGANGNEQQRALPRLDLM